MATYVPVRLPELTQEQVDDLTTALLRAKAAELSEVRRANTLVSTGYGDRAGGTLAQEAEAGERRIAALQVVLDALRDS